MLRKLNLVSCISASMLVCASANAIQFDGFLTAGMTRLDDNDNQSLTPYQGITGDTRFDVDSRFGLQISSDIAEDMSVVAQLLAAGNNDNFNAIIEWAYVDYEFNDSVSVRGGKIKEPVFLISDYVEVGYAYPWIRPPAEVYSNNPLNTVNGVEFLIQYPVGKNVFSIQPYLGTNTEEIPGTNGAGNFEAVKIKGIDFKFTGRGYSVHASTLKTDVYTQGSFVTDGGGVDVAFDLNASGEAELTSVGFSLDMANIVAYAEWQDRDIEGVTEALFPDQDSSYVTLGYRFGKWMPHITFASIDGQTPKSVSDVTCAEPLGCGGATVLGSLLNPNGAFPYAKQDSITYGLRYELNDSAAVKIEHQVVDVASDVMTFGLFDPSFAAAPTTEKVNITSFAVDVIF